MFIEEVGAHYNPDGQKSIQFVAWDSGGVKLQRGVQPLTGEEARQFYEQWVQAIARGKR